MFWLGKLLGVLFGYMMAGPFGAIFGLLLGHYFDISRKGHWFFFPPPRQQTNPKDIFFKATFTIMGYIAKADGRVSENEIRVATHIMHNMMLTHELRQQAIHYFRQGKQADFNLDQILSSLLATCYLQQHLLRLFLDIQLQAAYADGLLSKNKQKILEYICFKLNLNPNEFFQRTYHQSGYSQNQQKSYQRGYNYKPPYQPNTLEMAYTTLNVKSTITNSELKKTYRKLMSQHHPDKLISKGASEAMVKKATQKTQEIKSAYETICKARGIQ